MRVLDAALKAADDLKHVSVGIALVGGLAVSVRAEPRNTRDVDLAVSVPDDTAAERVVRMLVANGYGVVLVLEQEETGRLATVRLRRPDTAAVVIDLLFASSGLEQEVVRDAEPLEIAPNITLPVARTGHLIAMKLLSRDDVRRPQDRVDLAALISTADAHEIERAQQACALIEARNCARGRDLSSELRRALATWAPDNHGRQ